MTNALPVITADLGGTKTVIALVSHSGKIIDRNRFDTIASDGPEAVLDRLYSGIDLLLARNNLSKPEAVSLGIAGIIDMENGVVTEGPNLPGWEEIPLKDRVGERYGVPAYIINDADAATLGEQRYGAGKGLKNVVMITLGTGIGGGMVLDGKMYTGSTGSAVEIGHMVLKKDGEECGCGRRGCLETLASGTAIARQAKERITAGGKSSLTEIVNGSIGRITAENVHRAAKEGDSLALSVIEEAVYYLGLGVMNTVAIINPEMVVIGGSVAQMGDLLLEPVRRLVMEKSFPLTVKNLRIVTAKLGEDAGLLGAAACAFDER